VDLVYTKNSRVYCDEVIITNLIHRWDGNVLQPIDLVKFAHIAQGHTITNIIQGIARGPHSFFTNTGVVKEEPFTPSQLMFALIDVGCDFDPLFNSKHQQHFESIIGKIKTDPSYKNLSEYFPDIASQITDADRAAFDPKFREQYLKVLKSVKDDPSIS
jgi:hypothetical protein